MSAPENQYDRLRLAKENSLVLQGRAFTGETTTYGVYHLECHPSGLFVSKYEPEVESLNDLLGTDDKVGDPVEFSRVDCSGGKRKWFLASEEQGRFARRTCFVTPLYPQL